MRIKDLHNQFARHRIRSSMYNGNSVVDLPLAAIGFLAVDKIFEIGCLTALDRMSIFLRWPFVLNFYAAKGRI